MQLTDFRPAPGYILIEPLERSSLFAPLSKKDDTSARLGKVVQIGEDFKDGEGIIRPCPVTVGQTILYTHYYNNDELEIVNKQYPVVRFDAIRGVINAT